MIAHKARSIDAEVAVAPRFAWLVALALVAVILQATLLQSLSLRGAHLSLLTVLVVWTGLRCGIVAGGWIGFIGGLLEDALGGGGIHVIGTTLMGYAAGLLSTRFFWDSMPVFVGAVAGTTIVRSFIAYVLLAFALGNRGLFVRVSHATLWEVLLNCAAAALVLAALRFASHRQFA